MTIRASGRNQPRCQMANLLIKGQSQFQKSKHFSYCLHPDHRLTLFKLSAPALASPTRPVPDMSTFSARSSLRSGESRVSVWMGVCRWPMRRGGSLLGGVPPARWRPRGSMAAPCETRDDTRLSSLDRELTSTSRRGRVAGIETGWIDLKGTDGRLKRDDAGRQMSCARDDELHEGQ